MKAYLSERNIVLALFVLVLISFSLAHEDSKKAGFLISGTPASPVQQKLASQPLPNPGPDSEMAP